MCLLRYVCSLRSVACFFRCVQASDRATREGVSLNLIRYVAIETDPYHPDQRGPGAGRLLRGWNMLKQAREKIAICKEKALARSYSKLARAHYPLPLVYRRTTAGMESVHNP